MKFATAGALVAPHSFSHRRAAAWLAACSSRQRTRRPGHGSTLPKTLVFSPLSLAPPALKGLSEGVKGYAGSKGWDVIVQDPNFDADQAGPAVQRGAQLRPGRRRVGDRGRARSR